MAGVLLNPGTTYAELRQRFAWAVATLSTPEAKWHESRYGYEQFGLDSNTIAHRGYVVSPIQTTELTGQSRQRGHSPAYVETTIGIQFLWVLRSKFPISDRDAAASAELELAQAVSLHTRHGGRWSSPRFVQTVRREVVGTSPHLLTELHWSVQHHLALTL